MLNYKEFVDNKLIIDESKTPVNVGNLSNSLHNPSPAPAPAPTTSSPTNKNVKLKDAISEFLEKIKNKQSQQKKEIDTLTLKTKNYTDRQSVTVKMEPNIELSAIVLSEVINMKTGSNQQQSKKYFKLIKSNIEEISILFGNDQQSNIIDPVTNRTIKNEKKPVYFQTFVNKNNKKLTNFYFYNNTDFIRNPKVKPVFFKSYLINSIS